MHLVDIGSTKQFLYAFLQPYSLIPARPQDPSYSGVIQFVYKLLGAAHCCALCTGDHSPAFVSRGCYNFDFKKFNKLKA